MSALLDAVTTHQVTELVALAARAHTCGTLAHLAPAGTSRATQPGRGISGPVSVEHWADEDLLVPTDPAGDASAASTRPGPVPVTGETDAGRMTLLDVKTVISLRDPDQVGR